MLGDLYASALAQARARETKTSAAELTAVLAQLPAPLDALQALTPAETVRVIAEVKHNSPGREPYQIADVQILAQQLEAAGADAISVVTSQAQYDGQFSDLAAVRKAVSLPVLHKDFIATEYQLLESRVAGADVVQLLTAGLEQPLLQRLMQVAAELGLTVLLAAHTAEDVSRAVDVGAEMIAINARNPHSQQLHRDVFGALADQIPAGVIRVAESGIATVADVEMLRDAGADVVLVGQALLKAADPAALLSAFSAVS